MTASRKHKLRQPTSVYAFLKVQMGEAGLAISAIEASPYATLDAVSTIYTPVHGYLAHGYALATCGRASEALGVLERWLGQPGAVILQAGERHLALMTGLLREAGTAGNLVNDVHLAALALEHGAEIVSFDGDFARFAGVRWRSPV